MQIHAWLPCMTLFIPNVTVTFSADDKHVHLIPQSWSKLGSLKRMSWDLCIWTFRPPHPWYPIIMPFSSITIHTRESSAWEHFLDSCLALFSLFTSDATGPKGFGCHAPLSSELLRQPTFQDSCLWMGEWECNGKSKKSKSLSFIKTESWELYLWISKHNI